MENKNIALALFFAVAFMAAGCISTAEEVETAPIEQQSIEQNITEPEEEQQTAPAESSDEWVKNLGGEGEDYGKWIGKTSDGGYIIIGYSNSYSDEYYDAYVLKVNSNGEEEWHKTFGAQFSESIFSAIETKDGGYAIVGTTNSYDPEWASTDVYLLKIDEKGNQEWAKHYSYEGGSEEFGSAVKQTKDGGYIIVGTTNYYEKSTDIYVIKTDSSGNVEWRSVYGGDLQDSGEDVLVLDDGYIVVGSFTPKDKFSDVYIMKIDENGDVVWAKDYGGEWYDQANSITEALDNGYVITGGMENGKLFAMKIDEEGNKEWEKEYTYKGYGIGNHIFKTSDGNYAIIGTYADVSVNNVYAVKINASGDVKWSGLFGKEGPGDDDYGEWAVESSDGELVIVGTTERPTEDILLIKTKV